MVKEWQEHTDHYQGYLTEDLAPHSETFLQSGHYTGDLGDLMILTLANVLHIPVTVFTSISNMPVLCVLPTTTQSIHSTQPIFWQSHKVALGSCSAKTFIVDHLGAKLCKLCSLTLILIVI